MRLIFVCLMLMAGGFLNITPAWAQADKAYESFKRQMSASPDIPWDLEADSVYYDRATDTYAAEGRAILSQPGKKIIADSLVMNRADMKISARGNVEIYVEDDFLKSDAVEVDLSNETGEIQMGYIFIRQNNFHINGELISKTGPDEYQIIEGSLTSCDGPSPDWRFESARTEITVDGYAYAYDTFFYVGSVPIFYTPFFIFPVKTTRQSGFLIPRVGVSERLGAHATLPFYWAINENQDATFYAQYMSKRGLKLGAEYRYDFGDYTGAFQADYLRDIRVDRNLGSASNQFGYDDSPNDAMRENRDRFWIRGTHRQEDLFNNFKFIAEIDYVSDQDYLREFRGGYMGYTESNKFFLKNHNWDMEGKEDFIRTNKLLLNRIWNAASLNIQTVWYDDIIARQSRVNNLTVQKLPTVSYDIRRQKIGDMPLFFSLNSEYGNFWRQNGPSAQRVDLHPRFYAPINFGLFTLEPSVGLRETYWYQYDGDLANINDKNSHNRFMVDTRTRLSTQFNRVYNFDDFTFGDIKSLQHTITPEIIYDYIPNKNQDDLPYFTNSDRISKRNQIFASLTTSFTTKTKLMPRSTDANLQTDDRDHANAGKVDSVADPSASFQYLEVLRLSVKQGYDFDSSQEGKNANVMPLAASIKFQPVEGLRLSADAAWSFNVDTLVSRNISLTAWDRRGDSLFISWRNNKNYDDPYNMSDIFPDSMLSRYYINANKNLYSIENERINSLYTSATLKLTPNITLFGDNEYNFADHTRVETNAGIRYSEQCWSVEFNYRDEKDGGISVGLFFTLLSIGDIGF